MMERVSLLRHMRMSLYVNTALFACRPYQYAWLLSDAVDDAVAWGPPQALIKVTLPPVAHTSQGRQHTSSTPHQQSQPRLSPQQVAEQLRTGTTNIVPWYSPGAATGGTTASPSASSPPSASALPSAFRIAPVTAPGTARATLRVPPSEQHIGLPLVEWRPGPRCFLQV